MYVFDQFVSEPFRGSKIMSGNGAYHLELHMVGCLPRAENVSSSHGHTQALVCHSLSQGDIAGITHIVDHIISTRNITDLTLITDVRHDLELFSSQPGNHQRHSVQLAEMGPVLAKLRPQHLEISYDSAFLTRLELS